MKYYYLLIGIFLLPLFLCAQEADEPIQIKGVFPSLTVKAEGIGSTSETGIGALIPWANKLWAIGYVAHIRGNGIGLYEISEDMHMRLHPESVTGTFANRLIHWESSQALIGPHLIDPQGEVRTIELLSKHRLTSTCRHLKDPKNWVYYLTMEGLLFEANVHSLEVRQLVDLKKELYIDETGGQVHFKGAFSSQGRLVVANNTYEEPEFLGERAAGRLAEWDGENWTILEKNPFVEVSGKQNPNAGARYGNTLFATGWTKSSVVLRVLHDGKWSRYLLPKASHSFDHTWNTEWMRIREAQTERYLMDIHGMFYELPPMIYGGKSWGIKPIAHHLRIVPDFCYWNGLFVMAGDQTDNAVGQPQSGFWFGNIDELWNMGKPKGWGGPWWVSEVKANKASDPFLMTGFDKKTLHLSNHSEKKVRVKVEVDYLGNGSFNTYQEMIVPAGEYEFHVFPDGYSAHWVRLSLDQNAKFSAYFMYN